jgi:hypothetical protein
LDGVGPGEALVQDLPDHLAVIVGDERAVHVEADEVEARAQRGGGGSART